MHASLDNPGSKQFSRGSWKYLTFSLLVSFFSCGPSYAVQQPEQSLDKYLPLMAAKLDFYYTIESVENQDGSSVIGGARFRPDEDFNNIDTMIVSLQRKFPNTVIIRNTTNPAIVHFIDGNLSDWTKYGMGQKIDLSFTGTAHDLVTSIHRQIPVINNTSGETLQLPIDDDVTSVHVHAKGQIVRDLLCNSIPLSMYNRCLWIANTSTSDGKRGTTVVFIGARGWPPNDEHPDKREKVELFAKGEAAYVANPNTPELVKDAIEFINKGMIGDRIQIRWAMLFLGKCKSNDGIPILLKYIDYQYTKGAPIDEQFPALKALAEIGKPAAQASLKAMVSEADDQRLELLCRVILAVDGKADGVKSVENTAKSADAHQGEKIRAALAKVQQSLDELPATRP